MPTTKIQVKTTDVAGLKVFYREAGDPSKPTIVLLHGFPTSSYQFHELILLLADGFHLIAPDYPGMGHSDVPDPTVLRPAFDDVTREAIRRSETVLGRERKLHRLRAGYGSFTPREVMTLAASGMPNKLIGGELGISEITVKMHRGSVMRKMKADSFAQLVNMASRLRVTRTLRPGAISA
jgi:DNA-binding CsgD family transcriptional regulator